MRPSLLALPSVNVGGLISQGVVDKKAFFTILIR